MYYTQIHLHKITPLMPPLLKHNQIWLHTGLIIFVAMSFFLSAFICIPASAVEKIPVIIDIDNGPDDILAVITALKSDNLDIKAITISGDESTIDSCAVDVTKIVKAIRKNSNIPVIRAFPRDLRRNPRLSAAKIVTKSQYKNATNKYLDERYAHDVIIDAAIKYNPITIAASGSLGNISIATNKHRGPMYGIRRLIWTGGRYPVFGQISSIIESNEYIDPISNKEVFSADYPITTLGNINPLKTYTLAECEDFIKDSPASCKKIFKAYFKRYTRNTKQTTCPINALIGIAICMNPQIITDSEIRSKTTLIKTVDYDLMNASFKDQFYK